jgi:hypothetical protein
MEKRYYWGDVLAELRRVLIRSEDDIKKKLSAEKPGVEAGIWIEQMTMGAVQTAAASRNATAPVQVQNTAEVENADGTTTKAAAPANPASTENPAAVESPAVAGNSTGNTVILICRAVNLSNVDSAANTDIAYAVLKAFQEDPLFDPKATQLRGDITPDDVTGTFTFGITVGLKNPLNL